MKRLPLLICGFFLTSTLHAADLSEEDKEKHMGASAGISMVSYGAFRAAKFGRLSSSLMSFTMAMAVGHLKETQDPIYDGEDMQANAVGATLGILIPVSFTF